MTPSLPLSASIPAPSSPSQAQKPAQVKAKDDHASRDIAKDSAKTSQIDKNRLVEKKETTESSVVVFEEMMAALLNMRPAAPAVTQETETHIDIKPAANDIAQDSSGQALPEYGAAFNMEPALLIVPQNSTGSKSLPPVNVSGEFTTEILSALTPGLPSLPADNEMAIAAPAAIVPVPVPVPVATSENTTPALTVFNDIPADPRVIATGLDPQQMEALKNQLTVSKQQTQSGSAGTAPAASEAVQTSLPVSAAAPVNAQLPSAPPAQPVNVITVNLIPGIEKTIPAAAVTQLVDDTSSIHKEPEISSSALAMDTESVKESPDTGFDPVEFRIAQKYQRVFKPAASSTSLPAEIKPVSVNPDMKAALPASQPVAAQADIKGKIDSNAGFGSALLPSTTLASSTGFTDGLAVAPSSLPLATTTLTSPVTQSSTAAQSHPAVQTVAAVMNKAAKENTTQTISMRLDPPDLGKLEIQMKYKKGDPLKVHVVLEKADTAAMFQRDAHVLEAALKDAGIQADGSSLSFEMAGGGQSFQGQTEQGHSRPSSFDNQPLADIVENQTLETSMDIVTDHRTGLTHYNLKV